MNKQVDIGTESATPALENAGGSKRDDSGLPNRLIYESFALLAPQVEELTANFYQLLFERYPTVKPLFNDTTPEDQSKKLAAALQVVVDNLENPEALVEVLTQMGDRHQAYGALEPHYGAVSETLIDAMAELAGSKWNSDFEDAWREALELICDVMLSAYN